MSPEPVVLVAAVFSLTTGLVLYAWLVRSNRTIDSERVHLFSWLLVALFPVLLIFSFFPQNEFTGEIRGFTMSGAVAAFIFIWWYGTQSGMKASRIDALRTELAERNDQIEDLKEQLRTGAALEAPQPLDHTRTVVYAVSELPHKRVGVITGDLRNIRSVDVWVNSENTDMQMSRFHERSISGTIRYEGAARDPTTGRVVEDRIANELRSIMGTHVSVEPGTAIVTGPGELASRNNVMAVVHLAAVQGTPGMGYRQVENLGACVRNALAKAAEVTRDGRPARSVIFPILGAGIAGAGAEPTVRAMMGAAVEEMRADSDTALDTVYLLAYTDAEFAVCLRVLQETEALVPVDGAQRGPARRRKAPHASQST